MGDQKELPQMDLNGYTIDDTQLTASTRVFPDFKYGHFIPFDFRGNAVQNGDTFYSSVACLNWTNLFLWQKLGQGTTPEQESAYREILSINIISDESLIKIKEIVPKVDSVLADQLRSIRTYSDLQKIQHQIKEQLESSSISGNIARINGNVTRIEAKLSELESKFSNIETNISKLMEISKAK